MEMNNIFLYKDKLILKMSKIHWVILINNAYLVIGQNNCLMSPAEWLLFF